MKAWILVSVLSLTSISVAQANQDPAELTSYVSRLSLEEYSAYLKKAKDGDAASQLIVGIAIRQTSDFLYEFAWRTDKLPIERIDKYRNEAFEWFHKAAAQGDLRGSYLIAVPDGRFGIPGIACKDYETEMQRLANNIRSAMFELGELYDNPRCGVKRDNERSRFWWERASQAGSLEAQHALGNAYDKESQGGATPALALQLWRRAAESGYAPAQNSLGIVLSEEMGNQVEAVEWFRKAAEQGNVYAQCNLGLHYFRGLGVKKDLREALRWTAISDRVDRRCHVAHDEIAPLLPEPDAKAVMKEVEDWINSKNSKQLGYQLSREWLSEHGLSE